MSGMSWEMNRLTRASSSAKSFTELPANFSTLKFAYLVRFFNSDPDSLLSFNSNYKQPLVADYGMFEM